MRFVSIFFTIALFIVALGFALSNTQMTELRFFLTGTEPLLAVPLVILLLGFFLVGVAFGMLTGLPSYLRQKAELMRLRRQLRKLEEARAAAAAATPIVSPPAPAPSVSVLERNDHVRIEG